MIIIVFIFCLGSIEATITIHDFLSYRQGSCYYDNLYQKYNDFDIYLGRVDSTGYGQGYRGFMMFDLSSLNLSGHSIKSAKLILELNYFRSHDYSAPFGVYDMNLSPIPEPASRDAGLAIYNDLGTGECYGDTIAYPQSELFEIPLSEQVFGDITNGNRESFTLGLSRLGTVPNRGYSDNYLHLIGPGPSPHYPVLEITLEPIPEPCVLLLLGFGGLLFRKQQL